MRSISLGKLQSVFGVVMRSIAATGKSQTVWARGHDTNSINDVSVTGRNYRISPESRDDVKFSIGLKLMTGFVLAFSMLTIMGTVTFNSTVSLVNASSKVNQSHEVIGGLERMLSWLKDAETGYRSFIITGEELYLEPIETGLTEIEHELKNIAALTSDSAIQQKKLDTVEVLIQLRLQQLSEGIAQRREAGFKMGLGVLGSSNSGNRIMDSLRNEVALMQAEERRLLEQRAEATASTAGKTKAAIFLGSLVSMIIFGVIALFLSRTTVNMVNEVKVRKRAEEETNSLARFPSENPGPIVRVATDGTILYSNPAGQLLLPDEYSEVGRITTEAWRQIVSESLATGAETSVEVNWESRDFSFAVVPIVDAGYVNLYGRDITNRKLAEEELRTLASNLETSNRELQDFASVASHDLQEPLRKILAFGDRLRSKCNDALSEQGQDYLQRMMDAAQRMRDLIDDLLTLSRVSSQGNPIVPVDLAVIAAQVISDLEVAVEQSEGRIEVGELPTIDADATQMRQLLQNLISNALKFHKPDEPVVVKVNSRTINDYSIDGAGGASVAKMVELTVEDTGIGFDETYSDRIFKVFQRLHGKDQYSGTGLGLAVCRKIAERHNGTITAKSKPGQGAKFIATLPSKCTQGERERARNGTISQTYYHPDGR